MNRKFLLRTYLVTLYRKYSADSHVNQRKRIAHHDYLNDSESIVLLPRNFLFIDLNVTINFSFLEDKFEQMSRDVDISRKFFNETINKKKKFLFFETVSVR